MRTFFSCYVCTYARWVFYLEYVIGLFFALKHFLLRDHFAIGVTMATIVLESSLAPNLDVSRYSIGKRNLSRDGLTFEDFSVLGCRELLTLPAFPCYDIHLKRVSFHRFPTRRSYVLRSVFSDQECRILFIDNSCVFHLALDPYLSTSGNVPNSLDGGTFVHLGVSRDVVCIYVTYGGDEVRG